MKEINKTWGLIFLIYFLIIILIIVFAYLNLFPDNLGNIIYVDKISHFFLLGLLGYLLHRSLNRKTIFFIPFGPFLIAIFSIFDEALQVLSSVRTTDVYDLLADLGGIIFFVVTDQIYLLFKISKRVK